jgi:serine/threonine protein kinase
MEVKIADFGLAKYLDEAGSLSAMVGHPAFMAPEATLMNYDKGVDIWSFGILIPTVLKIAAGLDVEEKVCTNEEAW